MLIRLLTKWQTLEPYVCRYGMGVFRDSFFIQTFYGDWISISSTRTDSFFFDCVSVAKLQAFLQSKLDLRGWNWSVARLPNSYMAIVDIPNRKVVSSRQPRLIEALLDAYLQALDLGKSLLLKKKEVSNG